MATPSAVPRNQVYFAEPPAKIAQEYLEPVIRQETSRGCLGRPTQQRSGMRTRGPHVT